MWGECRNKSYWRALREEPDYVKAPERRAVSLLATLLDPERLAMFLETGTLYVLGNVTRRTYAIVHDYCHGVGLYEIIDGQLPNYWCTMPGDISQPITDVVLTVKNLIEGEEMHLRQIANKHGPEPLNGCDETLLEEFCGIYHRDPHQEGFFGSGNRDLDLNGRSLSHDRFDLLQYRDAFFNSPLPQAPERKRQRGHLTANDTYDYRYPHDNEFMLDPPGLTEFPQKAFGESLHIDRRDPLHMYETGQWDDREPMGYPGPRAEDLNATRRFNQAHQLSPHAGRELLDDTGLVEDYGTDYLLGFEDGMRTARPRVNFTTENGVLTAQQGVDTNGIIDRERARNPYAAGIAEWYAAGFNHRNIAEGGGAITWSEVSNGPSVKIKVGCRGTHAEQSRVEAQIERMINDDAFEREQKRVQQLLDVEL